MPEKQKTKSWKGIHAMIAAISMVVLLTLCNIIAMFDQQAGENNADGISSLLYTPTPQTVVMPGMANATAMSNQVVTRTRSS